MQERNSEYAPIRELIGAEKKMERKEKKTDLPNLVICVFFKRIQVASYSPFKHRRILGDNAQPWPQIVQANWQYVDAIYHNLTGSRVDNSEKCLYESWFSTACSPYNASLHSSGESASETSQHKWHMWGISNLKNYPRLVIQEQTKTIHSKNLCISWCETRRKIPVDHEFQFLHVMAKNFRFLHVMAKNYQADLILSREEARLGY